MATQYEVEHNVSFNTTRRDRRPDMSSFFNLLSQIAEPNDDQHHNPHAIPTPADISDLFRLLRDQLRTVQTLNADASEGLAQELLESIESDIYTPPTTLPGVSQEFVDSMDRVDRKTLKPHDDCAICRIPYLEDQYCLVVELPCNGRHRFDLECVGPWLRSKGNCPLCRQELGKKKEPPPPDSDDEGSDPDGLYA